MVTIVKEIETDWYLIQLEGTRYYQVWNKWDLFKILLKDGFTLVDEDFPMSDKEFNERFKKMKEVNEFQKELNNTSVKITIGEDLLSKQNKLK